MFNFNQVEFRQLVIDILNFIIAFTVISYWHVSVLTIHRFYISLLLLLFAFLLFAMLGPQIWLSGVTVPMKVIGRFNRLFFYTKSIGEVASDKTKVLYDMENSGSK